MVLIDPETDADAPEGEARDIEPHELRAAVALDNADATLAAPRPDPRALRDWERTFAQAHEPQPPREVIVTKRAPEALQPRAAPPVAYLTKTDAAKYQSALEEAIGMALKRQREVIEAAWRERVTALETRLAQLEARLAVAENQKGRRK